MIRQGASRWSLLFGIWLVLLCAKADGLPGTLVQMDSARPTAHIPVFLQPAAGAGATVVLLPGGAGGIGRVDARGWPDGGNFLIRSGALFSAQGFNVAMIARPSDQSDMGYPFRISAEHMDDLAQVLRQVRSRWPVPVWLVGTSRGTVSTTAAAIALREQGLIDGVVLTSSIVRTGVTGAVPAQDLTAIQIPVLVLHHRWDACKFCTPAEVHWIVDGLRNSPQRKLMWIDSGEGIAGDPCEAHHYHGFQGAEAQAVQMIGDWVRQPRN